MLRITPLCVQPTVRILSLAGRTTLVFLHGIKIVFVTVVSFRRCCLCYWTKGFSRNVLTLFQTSWLRLVYDNCRWRIGEPAGRWLAGRRSEDEAGCRVAAPEESDCSVRVFDCTEDPRLGLPGPPLFFWHSALTRVAFPWRGVWSPDDQLTKEPRSYQATVTASHTGRIRAPPSTTEALWEGPHSTFTPRILGLQMGREAFSVERDSVRSEKLLLLMCGYQPGVFVGPNCVRLYSGTALWE